MNIFDLTRGKYSQFLTETLYKSIERMLDETHVGTITIEISNSKLDVIPVFIVESSMAGEV